MKMRQLDESEVDRSSSLEWRLVPTHIPQSPRRLVCLLVYSDTSGSAFGAAVDRPGESIQFQDGLSFRHLDRGSEPRPIRRNIHFVARRKRGFAVHRASELDG